MKPRERERYNKILEIISKCKPDNILDVGCAGMEGKTDLTSGNWLHGEISSKFSNVIGIDINKEAVSSLASLGYDIRSMDAEKFNFDFSFDLVVASELIEHLNNPGNFLSCCSNALKNYGNLILSTPYPFNLDFFMSSHFKKNSFIPGEGHTAWFCPKTLEELASRYNLKLKEIHFVEYDYQPSKITLKSLLYHKLLKRVLRLIGLNKLFRGCMILVFEKEK